MLKGYLFYISFPKGFYDTQTFCLLKYCSKATCLETDFATSIPFTRKVSSTDEPLSENAISLESVCIRNNPSPEPASSGKP